MRALAALAVLLGASAPVAGLAVHMTPPPAAFTDVPLHIPVTIEAGPGAVVEVKVWLGPDDRIASRTWTGSTWQRSDRYASDATTGPDGTWTGTVVVAANPDSANWGALTGAATARLGVRIRSADGTADAVADVPVRSGTGAVPFHHAAPASLAVVEEGVVVFAARLPSPLADDWIDLPALAGAELLVDGVVAAPGEARLVAVDGGPDGLALIEGAGRVVVVHADTAQALEAPATVGLTGAADGVALWSGLQLRDCARFGRNTPGDAPACPVVPQATGGWAVRDGAAGPWLPWTLPRGELPQQLERFPVVGGIATAATGPARTALALHVIGSARSDLWMTAYTLTSTPLASAVADAARRGVNVRLLVEDAPVGGRPPQEDALLAALAADGVSVRLTVADERGLLHAKAVVADNATALVSSENWSDGGHPADGTGNVGWSVAVSDASLARAVVAHVARWWGRAAPLVPVAQPVALVAGAAAAEAPAFRPARANVTVLVAPVDAWRAEGVPASVASAGSGLDLLLLRLATDDDPWLDAVLERARAGVPTRVLLNGVAFDEGHDPAAQDGASELAAIASDVPPLRVHLSDPRRDPVHAKGLVVDGRVVLVGSSNWGPAGLRVNREIGLLIDDAPTAAFFSAAFEEAWYPPAGGPALGPLRAPVPGGGPLGAILALAMAYSLIARRRTGKGPL